MSSTLCGEYMDKIAVLIPCYNEGLTIYKVVKDFKTKLPEAVIYVYDNNSTDDTEQKALEAGAIVRHEFQQGKGNVVRRMFREIEAECYILVDGDDTYPADAVGEMVNAVIDRNADMVVGDRLSSTYARENKRPFHNMGNILVKWAVNFLFKTNIRDIMTGYRALSYQFVKSFPVLSKGFEIETEMSIHAADKNLQVDNIVIDYRDRPDGSQSKLNTYSDGFRVIKTILRLFRIYKPAKYFTMYSLILTILSVTFVVPVIIDYGRTGLVERFPTLIVCGFTLIAAILSFYAGAVLQTIRNKDLQDYEHYLYQISTLRKILEGHNNVENKASDEEIVHTWGGAYQRNFAGNSFDDNSIQSTNSTNAE